MQNHQNTFITSFFSTRICWRDSTFFYQPYLQLFWQTHFLNHTTNFFLTIPVEIRIGALNISKNLLLWINDGLMAIFFFFGRLGVKTRVD
ncbi:Na+/H+ antiporter NhaA [Candidatus Competibacter phosphatis]|uniref:Na+/H+ antiporter NhaA n=1 Tax=Candidatus Competibacter phosphatis TaxID=221280 RepID=UPI003B968576